MRYCCPNRNPKRTRNVSTAKATLTAFKSAAPGGAFYDLESAVFYIKLFADNETANLGVYVTGCKAQGIKPVALVDRKVRVACVRVYVSVGGWGC
jgi:hypothetical protein